MKNEHRPAHARLFGDERGQDLIEYTLLIAFVVIAAAVLIIGMGGSISGIWSGTNDVLDKAPQKGGIR